MKDTPLIRKYKKSLLIILCGLLVSFILVIALLIAGFVGASKPQSYLPEVKSDVLKPQDPTKIILKNSKYELLIGSNGSIKVQTPEGDEIMSNLVYFSSCAGTQEKWGMDSISVNMMSDSTVLINGLGQLRAKVKLLLMVPKNRPVLEVSINTEYYQSTVVNRESMVAAFDVPVTEVFLKNRQVENTAFEPEYWLRKEGVRLGTGHRSALVYKTPNVSSLQLDSKKELLFLNLDYSLDHLFLNIPYQEDNGGKWVDQSTSLYLPGDKRENNFLIHFGEMTKNIPRIMLVPDGYLAGYVFTEHADGGTLKTNRAAYFGSEEITDISKATRGFAGHKIPTTKSVFYADPDSAAYCSVKDDPEYPAFLDFLYQLDSTGRYEICLHTPENLSSNRQRLEESIKFMKERFETETWIDHGMFSGKINRETMVGDGLDPKSEFYSADLWEKYNTQYFWSAAVEEIRKYSLKKEVSEMKFYEASKNLWRLCLSPRELREVPVYSAIFDLKRAVHGKEELNSLLPGKGDAFPTPLFWQHPTRTRKFYSWTTEYFKKYNDLSDEKVKAENIQLTKLIDSWGVFINHGYFVRNLKVDVLIEVGGKLEINHYFDEILKDMASMRDEGNLYISTIKELMNYWIMTENVSFDFLSDGRIDVYNNNDQPISGLSMAVRSDYILVDGNEPKQRKINNDIIFWFDMPPKGHVILTFPSKHL